ncbi:putative disease resistance RPP13-like protein 3 [Silene latifolia]|uniref:putative disease resistance RPP13-like protein 3 n=1 Tax=Silene latifolia TaxID=37657 RepID=UPI003D7811F9
MASSTVVSAVQWIGSQLVQEARPLFNVEEEVQGLKYELECMLQYLQDADARQDDKKINASVRQIRKLAYDAEDVIDTYILKVRQSNENWVLRSARVIYKFRLLYQIREKIQLIHTRLKQVGDNLNSLGLRKDTGILPFRRERPPSYRYDDIHGRFDVGLNKDLPKLLEVLTGEGKTHVHFLAIVGMGGSGKTTLARKLYNHPYVGEYFSCTAWVSVSQEWSTSDILSKILREVRDPEATLANFGTGSLTDPELIDMIRNTLKKKSYLVVIDDVWKREALDDILSALPLGYVHGGSKIIITTRNQDIVQFQNTYHYKPAPLSDEEGWELFHKIALSHRKHCSEASFENLGKEMLKKCDGLPLAIVALAGILNMKDSIAEWYQVNEAVRSRAMDNIASQYGRVGDMLALSYDDLPYYLKPCFLYLSLFPEDFEVPVGMLTRMWIAEGLVSAPEDMPVEDAAMQHLEELSHRFLIQVVRINYKGVIKVVRLHDLLRDVGLRKAKELNFLQIYAPVSVPGFRDKCASEIQPRRAALHYSNSFPAEISYLRSLVLLKSSNTPESGHNYTETLDLKIVPRSYKLLRLLTLKGIRTVNGSLPTEIGSLLHLRYLEIRGTNITKLPGSIGKLRCLLVLDYRDVVSKDSEPIIEIPNVLWKLVLLRHLFLPIDCQWNVEELILSTLPNLLTLWGVKQDKAGHQWLSREIPKLSSTVKKLKIVVSSEDELQAAFSNPSIISNRLQTFHCELQGGITLLNVEPLCHQRCLHKLILIGQVRMPLSLILPTNLVTLKLKGSMLKDEDPMTALGVLSHLKLLILSNAFEGTELVCKPGSFPQLEELYLENLLYFQMWMIHDGAMPCLKKLEITRCGRLQQFPSGLEFVTTLQQFDFDFAAVPASFISEAAKYGLSTQNFRLPSNFGAIISRADSPVDTSSIHKLYAQLTTGIFLDNKKQKYWVVERHNIYCNCFMVYALRLLPSPDFIGGEHSLRMRNFRDIDGIVSIYPDWCEKVNVHGRFSTADLSSPVTYEIIWLVMLAGWVDDEVVEDMITGGTIVHTELSYLGHALPLRKQHKQIDSMDGWVEVPGGEFEVQLDTDEEMQVSMHYTTLSNYCYPLSVKGFIIQPKP